MARAIDAVMDFGCRQGEEEREWKGAREPGSWVGDGCLCARRKAKEGEAGDARQTQR